MDNTDVLSRLVQAHEAYDQSTAESRSRSERDRDYTDGHQWTDEEEAELKKRKQPVITVNRIKPKVDFLKGQEQQRRQMPRAFPRTPAEEDGASAATDAIRFVMDQSKWDRERSGCFDNHIVEGACAADVQVYEKADGDICIDVRQIPWDRMWGDEHSRQRDWSDAKVKGQYLWMDLEDAIKRWPDKKDDLEGVVAREGSKIGQTFEDVPRTRWADPKRRRVRIVEAWSHEADGKVYHTHFTEGAILKRIESPFVNEDGEPEDGFVFGSCFIDRDGNRYGVVRAWISIQDEINKRRSKALHLNSVRQTFGNQMMGDKNEVRRQMARPDGHIEVQAGAKFGEDFGILPTGDMANAQFDLLQEAKNEIDAVGVNAALSGNEERVMSGRALMAKSEQGLAELQPVFDAFAQFQHDVYRKVWNRIRQFWTDEKWVRVTDDERNVKFVGLNQTTTAGKMALERAQAQGMEITEEMLMQAQFDPAMQKVVKKNDIAKMDVDIVLDEVPASATLQTEAYEQLLEIAPQAATMPPPMFEALIEASPLRNKEKVLEKLRGGEQGKQIPPEIQQAMQEHEQVIQQLQEELAKAQAEAMKAKAAEPQMDLAMREAKLAYEQRLFEANKRAALLEIKMAAMSENMQSMKATNAAQMAGKDMQMHGMKAMHATDKMHQAGHEMSQAADDMRQEREQASEASD